MAVGNPLTWLNGQVKYLLYGPGANTPSSTQLIALPQPPPPLRTSLVFDSHIVTEAAATGRGRSKTPQTISSAWDERDQYGDTQRSWQGLTAQDRKAIMLDLYLNISAASSCIDVIAKRIFSGGFVVEKVDKDGPDNQAHYDTLNEFLLRINPDWDFNQLGRSLVADLLIYGECYGEIIPKDGLPWNLMKVDCIPMGFQANKYGQIERFYQVMGSTNQKNWLDPKNIVRWWFPHPRASVDPFAPIEKVTDAALIDKKMMLWMISFFQKGAKFNYYFKGVGDQDEADRFLTWFRQNFTGEKNAHIPPVTWGNAEIAPLGHQGPLQMDFSQGMDKMEVTIYGAYGVPPAAVSIIKTGAMGGHSESEQDKIFIFNACDPVKQVFFEKINDRITKRGFNIHDYRISAKYADYRSDKDMAEVEDKRIRNGSRTIDEIRMESGRRPYKVGGDVAVIVTTKEVTPVPRLADMEDEQRQNAQATLDTAQAQADLAQTKAKQAKEPPAPAQVQQPGLWGNGQQDGKNAPNAGKSGQDDEKSKQDSGKQQPAKEDDAQRPAVLQQHTGVMVALMIPLEIGQQLAIPDGEPVSDLHITLTFLGEKDDLFVDVGTLKTALKGWAANHPPLQGRIAGLGKFDAPDGGAVPIIVLPDIPGLPDFRQSLVEYLRMLCVDVNTEHGYTPHITLIYQDTSLPIPIADVPHLDLYFDHICLAVGDERFYFPLLDQSMESAPQYFTGKTELPQWQPDDIDAQIALLRSQGVIAVTSKAKPSACGPCLENDGKTVRLGDPFPSGHFIKPYHPNCDCENVYIHGEEEDEDDTAEMPAVKKTMLQLTESDLWEGRP